MGTIVAGKNLSSQKGSDDFENFQKVLEVSKEKLERDNSKGYKKKGEEFWKSFEQDVWLSMQKSCKELALGWEINYLGGHKFPDIVAKINEDRSFGVEVKTLSSSNENWHIMGGSIMESTSEKDVSRIHVFCAKKNPFTIKFRSFEDCVRDVAVTHSPRYMLDLDISAGDSLFKKIQKPYDEIRKMENPFSAFRNYLIDEKKSKGEDAWWMGTSIPTSDQEVSEKEFVKEIENSRIRFWNELDGFSKKMLICRMIIRFPRVLNGDYKEAAKWLYDHFVINPSFRDTFSAGGKGCVNGIVVPHSIANLEKHKNDIAEIFRTESIALEDSYPEIEKYSGRDKSKKAWTFWKANVLKISFNPQEKRALQDIVDSIGKLL